MIVKGHDFPKVTLVGALLADLSLFAGDYTGAERTFDLLAQAAGRAGRGDRPGEVVIQTYQPEHYAIVHAAAQDYRAFYEEEIAYRRLLAYPPAAHMLAIQYSGLSEDRTLTCAAADREVLSAMDPKLLLIGPAAARTAKLRDRYRFVLYIKASKYDTLVRCRDRVEEKQEENARAGVLVQFDFDPVAVF